MKVKDEIKIMARNKKASHDYFILESLEVGIVLTGTEIKSIRDNKVSINDTSGWPRRTAAGKRTTKASSRCGGSRFCRGPPPRASCRPQSNSRSWNTAIRCGSPSPCGERSARSQGRMKRRCAG